MFKSFRTRLTLITALALLLSAASYGQADSTMRRAFVPARQADASAAVGYSQILNGQVLGSQGLAGSPSGGSPMIAYGPYVNASAAALTISLSCNEGADHCITYGGPTPATIRYGNFFQVAPGSTYMFLMRDYGYVTVSATGSGLNEAAVGLPPASAFTSPTVVSSSNTYVSCIQNGTDNGDGTFTPNGGYLFTYTSMPTRSDRSSIWGGGGASNVYGPNPGVSTSTCSLGVGTYPNTGGGGT